jgi:type IV pilus biogenesis protein CpaD/CtpE
MTRYTTVLVLAPLALAGCGPNADPWAPTTAVNFGEAVRHNMAVQIVDPEPGDLNPPQSDADRTLLMIGRYKTGRVTPPQETTIGPLSSGVSSGMGQ